MGYLSKNKSVKSPNEKFIEFRGGKFVYWDKEKKENIEVKMPIRLLSIDHMIGVSGGIEDDDGNFHKVSSNIAAHLGKTLSVRKDNAVIARGVWKNISDTVRAAGGRYTVYEYCLMGEELVALKMVGATLKAFFDKSGSGDVITVSKTIDKKKGANKYKVPVFVMEELTEEDKKLLDESPEVQKFVAYREEKENQKFDSDIDKEMAQEGSINRIQETVEPDLSDDEIDVKLDGDESF
jgi:hypothetical protein